MPVIETPSLLQLCNVATRRKELRLPVYLIVPSYLLFAASVAGLLWLVVMGSPAISRWIAMAIWVVLSAPFVLAANQWTSTISVDHVGIHSRSVMRSPRTLAWDDLASVRLGVTSHARDDRSVVFRSKGVLGKKIAYSSARKGFMENTKFVVEEATRREVPVRAGMLDSLGDWNRYLGIGTSLPAKT